MTRIQFGANPIVVREEQLPFARSRVLHGHGLITWYTGCLAHPDNGFRNAWTAIAVDDQSGITGQDCKRIEYVRKLYGDARGANIPGNVALQILRGHT
jgi:hypothetical protein